MRRKRLEERERITSDSVLTSGELGLAAGSANDNHDETASYACPPKHRHHEGSAGPQG